MLTKVKLENPIKNGDTEVSEVTVRRPTAGEMRGVNLVDLGQLKVDALIAVIPRVTIPPLTKEEVENMQMEDLLSIGVEIGSFLLPKEKAAGSHGTSKTSTPISH